jgi:hypothetical protein
MKKYTYTGKFQHCATILVSGEILDLRLSQGNAYELPESHPHIKKLVATGLLVDANNISKK